MANSSGSEEGLNLRQLAVAPSMNWLAPVSAAWQGIIMDIGQFIVKTPGTCGGRARLAGKRIPVSSIYRWFLQGSDPEDILEKFDGVSLSEIYAAISYGLANLEEITSEIESEDQLVSNATGSKAVQPLESK
jgi:uncharacterized protein (DUF433 family)